MRLKKTSTPLGKIRRSNRRSNSGQENPSAFDMTYGMLSEISGAAMASRIRPMTLHKANIEALLLLYCRFAISQNVTISSCSITGSMGGSIMSVPLMTG